MDGPIEDLDQVDREFDPPCGRRIGGAGFHEAHHPDLVPEFDGSPCIICGDNPHPCEHDPDTSILDASGIEGSDCDDDVWLAEQRDVGGRD